MEKKQVLVISEDISFYRAIRGRMQDVNTEVLLIYPATKALSDYMSCEYCLVVLDWQSCDVSEEIIYMMRKAKYTPILLLIDEIDTTEVIALYQAGVNAFLKKPVDIELCVAQANALIRLYLDCIAGRTSSYPLMVGVDLVIDPIYRQVTLNGTTIELTRREFDLLYLLAQHPGQVYTLGQLYAQVWGDNLGFNNDETVRTHIKTLRKKLGQQGKMYIQNKWGVGYRLFPPNNL